MGRVDGDPAALLVLEAGLGLGQVGVDLQGQRGARGEDFEEEGQPGAEPGDGGGAQLAFGVGGDDVRERPLAGTAVDAGRGAWVGPHPHLGLRLTGGVDTEERGDGRGGSPGVGADRVRQAVHRRLPG